MSREIRCISIDGMERTGKTSVMREMRKFLKNKDLDLFEVNGTDYSKLEHQEIVLNDSTKSFILKENGLMKLFYDELKNFKGVKYIEENYRDIIRKEKIINHQHGVVNFFLIPEDDDSVKRMFGSEKPPFYYKNLIDFYMGINNLSISNGLDIILIPVSEHDRIFDVRDKIFKELENYNFSLFSS